MSSAPHVDFYWVGSLLAAALSVLGLAASFFHLGRPARAWRSAAMWRTSWLSREVIVLPAFIAAVLLYGLGHALGWSGAVWIGAFASIACLGLFLCTAMIYACLKFLQEWATPLTVLNFFLLGTASGFTLAAPFAFLLAPQFAEPYAFAAMGFTLGAWFSRTASLARNARLRPRSTLQSATGVRNRRVVQQSQGFTGGSFNTQEFFHGTTTAFLRAVKWGFFLFTFAVPLALITAGLVFHALSLFATAFVVQYAGLIAERWFFFAEANHPQNLYYQAIA